MSKTIWMATIYQNSGPLRVLNPNIVFTNVDKMKKYIEERSCAPVNPKDWEYEELGGQWFASFKAGEYPHFTHPGYVKLQQLYIEE